MKKKDILIWLEIALLDNPIMPIAMVIAIIYFIAKGI